MTSRNLTATCAAALLIGATAAASAQDFADLHAFGDSLTGDDWDADTTAGVSADDYGRFTRTTGSTLFAVARADTEGTTLFATVDGGHDFEAGPPGRDPDGGAVAPTGGVMPLARWIAPRRAAFLPCRRDSAAQTVTSVSSAG
ncbi:MAG: hypothetical protein V3R98_02865 [Alphaproteobacteria bacterium]